MWWGFGTIQFLVKLDLLDMIHASYKKKIRDTSHIQASPIPALPYERETILFTLKEKLKLGSYDVPTKDFLNYIFY